MEGLLLRLLETELPEPRFWKLFGSIRPDLDRLFWCFLWQPWMGPPDDFHTEPFLESFEGEGDTSVQLWRPGTLSLYADRFGEEYIELWAIEPTRDDAKTLAAAFNKAPWRDQDKFIEERARVWLLYTDSTCWEIYARKTSLIERLREALMHRRSVVVYESRSDQRGAAFGAAGLSGVWAALNRKNY